MDSLVFYLSLLMRRNESFNSLINPLYSEWRLTYFHSEKAFQPILSSLHAFIRTKSFVFYHSCCQRLAIVQLFDKVEERAEVSFRLQ